MVWWNDMKWHTNKIWKTWRMNWINPSQWCMHSHWCLFLVGNHFDILMNKWSRGKSLVSWSQIIVTRPNENINLSRLVGIMMTSWHGCAVHITGPLWGESTGWFPSQRVSYGSFDIFFFLSLNKLLTKQSICRSFETLWRWCDVTVREQSICADCLGWKVCGEEKNGAEGEPIYISVSAAALFGDNYDFFNYKIYNCRGQTSVTVLSCHWSLYLGRWICWQILNR